MPFNGSGTFVSLGLPDFPAVAGEIILADQFNDNLNDIFTEGLTKCITRDGQSPPTANIPMAGFKVTGLGDATAATDAVNLGQAFAKRGTIGAVDWDSRITYGMYEATAAALTGPASNFPSTSDLGQLLVLNQGSNIVHMYVTHDDVYTRRRVSGVWTAWTSLRAAAVLTATPPGTVTTFAMNTAPTGWLKCNGAAVSRTTYAALFAAIGTTFGVGDGSTTFNLPEIRGEFVRGWDDGRGVDTGRVFGSAQTDLTETHTHTASSGNNSASHTHGISITSANNSVGHTHTFSDTSTVNSVSHTHGISITSGTNSVGHTHTFSDVSTSDGAHNHLSGFTVKSDITKFYGTGGSSSTSGAERSGVNQTAQAFTSTDGAHTHTVSGTTGSQSANHTHLVSGTSATNSVTHTHDVSGTTSDISANHTHLVSGTSATNSVSHNHVITVDATGGTETRPRNIALLYCIKT